VNALEVVETGLHEFTTRFADLSPDKRPFRWVEEMSRGILAAGSARVSEGV